MHNQKPPLTREETRWIEDNLEGGPVIFYHDTDYACARDLDFGLELSDGNITMINVLLVKEAVKITRVDELSVTVIRINPNAKVYR